MQRLAITEHLQKWLGACFRSDDGVSAVEFSLFAPILFFGLLATVDVGLALSERMAIDHVLRAGAQSAMADQGADSVLDILEATAAKNFTVSDGTASTGGDSLTLSVDRYCACPDNPGMAVACSTTCSGSLPTFVYYRLSAAKTYDGMVIPGISFEPSMQVQIR